MHTPSFAKPRVVFSRCLGFDPCRYDGMIVSDEFTEKLSKKVETVTVCPEVMIGLGIPRDPIRVISTSQGRFLFQPSTGRDITGEMKAFTAGFLDSHPGIDGFILKRKSPSCGIRDVKQFSVGGEIIGRGTGFFGDAVLASFPHLAVEDESRLADSKIRDHFLTRIFASARLRKAVSKNSISALVSFDKQNRLLVTAYDRNAPGILEQLLVNPNNKPVEDIAYRYALIFGNAFSKPSSRSLNIKALENALGYFSEKLTKEERNIFAVNIALYEEEKLSLNCLIRDMKAWIDRCRVRYLMNQTYFCRYPYDMGD